jgi:hypothetical protein
MKRATALVVALTTLVAGSLAAQSKPSKTVVPPDPGWPRQRTNEQGRLVYYQPQVDEWKTFKELNFRMAFTFTPKGQKDVVGIIVLQAQTDVDVDEHSVLLSNFKITEVTLPSVAAEKKPAVDQLVRSFLPPDHTVVMSLDRLVATVEKSQAAPLSVTVQNDPPTIFVSNTPAILLSVEGEPVRADIAATSLGFVINSNFPLFFEKQAAKEYYLYSGEQWLKAASLEGPWALAPRLPAEMYKVSSDPKWKEMEKPILSLSGKGKPPTVFYTNKTAEVILFKGDPSYAQIPGTQLSYATNTDADLFVYNPTKDYYYLAAGRWFRATNLKGPWTYSGAELPPDFATIPEDNPAARVLVSVPGTDEAKDAVLLAQVPTTAVVDPKVAEQAKVTYNGKPEFKAIPGTSLEYATNTPDKVIKAGDAYYLCLQGVWFTSPYPDGPWLTAKTVPKEIYSIPPNSPVYNVTYVTQSTTDEGTVEASYTAGYMGTYIVGDATGAYLASGTGYYYPPYWGYPFDGYPIYYPYAATYGVGSYYNPYTGAYGVARGVYGPYGGAAAASSYNPYTGTYARGATAYGPYGSRSVAQAYNPYTGTYAATKQGSNTYGSWGKSVVSKGNTSALTKHYSNANGTIGSIQTSKGGGAIGVNTKNGGGFAGKTAGGDMYAGRNGNIYKNTGSGWSQYGNGSWSSVSDSASTRNASVESRQNSNSSRTSYKERSQGFDRTGSSSGFRDVDRDFQNRQRGGANSERFSNFQRSGGGGRSFSGGGRAGGGRRR